MCCVGVIMNDTWIYYQEIGVDALTGRPHTHDDMIEIIWVLRGGGNILIGDTLYRLEANCIYFVPALVFHCTHPKEPLEYVRSKVLFSRSLIKKILTVCNGLHILDNLERKFWVAECRGPEIVKRLERYCREAVELQEDGVCAEDIASIGVILQIIKCLAELHAPAENSISPTSGFLNHILSYINVHLQEPLSLNQIAEACHISKYHLCHLFKEQINMTIMQYITEQRISMAKSALLETDKSISVIATENGYTNFSHFCSAFRRAEGISPAAYRKKYRY